MFGAYIYYAQYLQNCRFKFYGISLNPTNLELWGLPLPMQLPQISIHFYEIGDEKGVAMITRNH